MKGILTDGEEKVMRVIWREGALTAKEICRIVESSVGWNKNTTYTVLKKLETKGYIQRDEPGFICTALVSQAKMRKNEVASLLEKAFEGSRKALFSALLDVEKLTEEEKEELRALIDKR